MKKCKFCDSENKNSAKKCSSCGGTSFINICENCGAEIPSGVYCQICGVKIGEEAKVCPNCGKKYYSAACPDCGYTKNRITVNATQVKAPKKKRSGWATFGLVLLWIYFLPIMGTIALWKNQKLTKKVKWIITAIIWLGVLIIFIASPKDSNENSEADTSKNIVVSEEKQTKIKNLFWSGEKDVTVKVGEVKSLGYVRVKVESYGNEVSENDIILVSENPSIATVEFKEIALNSYFYYNVIGVGVGETEIYAKTADGSIESTHRKIIVPQPIEVESLEITVGKSNIAMGEVLKPKVSYEPYNAENKKLIWGSSDENIATVDENGVVSPQGSGTATISATTSNGITSSFDVTVDATKTYLKLNTTHKRIDNANIGTEWSYCTEINGENVYGGYAMAVGDTLSIYARATEDDSNPDIGEAWVSHYVTEEDIQNGFEVSTDLYVTENAGQNAGQTAHFIFTFTFTP